MARDKSNLTSLFFQWPVTTQALAFNHLTPESEFNQWARAVPRKDTRQKEKFSRQWIRLEKSQVRPARPPGRFEIQP